jgi:hypothetical protein
MKQQVTAMLADVKQNLMSQQHLLTRSQLQPNWTVGEKTGWWLWEVFKGFKASETLLDW